MLAAVLDDIQAATLGLGNGLMTGRWQDLQSGRAKNQTCCNVVEHLLCQWFNQESFMPIEAVKVLQLNHLTLCTGKKKSMGMLLPEPSSPSVQLSSPIYIKVPTYLY